MNAPVLRNSDQSTEEILSKNLLHLMQKHQLSEAELSRQAHIPQPTIHKILTGKTDDPRISTVQALASFFGTGIDQLYNASPKPYNEGKPTPSVQSIPILSWKDCLKGPLFPSDLNANNWSDWLVTDNLEEYLYAVRTKPSMEPRFTQNSLLVVNSKITPIDGDMVVVHYPDTAEATLRRILIDGPRKVLTYINDENEEKEQFNEKINVLGVVTQVRLDL